MIKHKAALLLAVSWFTIGGAPAIAQELRAQLAPRDFTTLAAEIGAKIERIPFREGDRFSKGQTLIAFVSLSRRRRFA